MTDEALNRLEDEFRRKVEVEQAGIPTAFDNLVLGACIIVRNNHDSRGALSLLEYVSSANKFLRYQPLNQRLTVQVPRNMWELTTAQIACQQGVNGPISWHGQRLFKTAVDMAIYPMLLQELRPSTIVEIGSTAGSATWLLDLTDILGLDTIIISVDLHPVQLEHNRLISVQGTCDTPDVIFARRCVSDCSHPLLIIEDAHVNVEALLLEADKYMKSGDYLVVEDSAGKQNGLYGFAVSSSGRYDVDCKYTDFFGRNVTTCVNSILRRA